LNNLPSTKAKGCEFSLGNKKVALLYDKGSNKTEILVCDFEKVMKDVFMENPLVRLDGITQMLWGKLNKSISLATTKGFIRVFLTSNGSDDLHSKIHKDEITSITFSKDRIFLFTASKDETYCMVDPDTLEVLKQYNFHGNFARTVAISPLYVPDAKPARRFHILVGGGQDEKEVTITGKKGGFEIKLVNYVTSEELAEIKGHFGPVHSLAFNPDGKSFASGSEDGYARLHFFHGDYYTSKFE
jgi:translation initiation factor 3 subunit I